MPYTFVDVVIVAVFLLGIFAGTGQGIIRQGFSLLGLIVGIMLASRYYQGLAGSLAWVGNSDGAKLAAFVVIAGVVLVVASVIGDRVHKLLGFPVLGCVGWLGGGLLGAVETLLLVDIALLLVLKYPVLGLPQAIQEARLPSVVFTLAPAVLALLPTEFGAVTKLLQ